MMKQTRRQALALALSLAAATGAGPLWAQSYPSKPITIVVAYPAGGDTDALARLYAEKLSTRIGQPVVIDNKPGTSGVIGSSIVSKAPADGYTLLFAPSTFSIAQLVLKTGSGGYDVLNGFTPIIQTGTLPLALVSTSASGIKSFKDLASASKSQPLTYASPGSGSPMHILGEMVNKATGLKLAHVPYKGVVPAVNDLLGGVVEYMFEWITAGIPFVTSNPPKMRALAITSDKRSPQLPNVPTFDELGVKGMVMSNWFGIVGPKNMPPAIVAKLNAAINQALADPELKERITSGGNEVGGGDPQVFAKFIASESDRWSKLIKAKGIKPE